MMAEEHQLVPVDRPHALRSALVVGVAAVIGSLIPIVPFFFLPVGAGSWASVLLTSAVLFVAGALKARFTVGRPWKSGLEMAIIGTVCALVGYAVGAILKAPLGAG
jgi:predicted membrane protein (TIGR00267 family)